MEEEISLDISGVSCLVTCIIFYIHRKHLTARKNYRGEFKIKTINHERNIFVAVFSILWYNWLNFKLIKSVEE
jgi:hypothetical protein